MKKDELIFKNKYIVANAEGTMLKEGDIVQFVSRHRYSHYFYKDGIRHLINPKNLKPYIESKEEVSEDSKTLEEAAVIHSMKMWGVYFDDKHPDIAIKNTMGEISIKDFVDGANWQKEQTKALQESHRDLWDKCNAYEILINDIIGNLKDYKDMHDWVIRRFDEIKTPQDEQK